ncbi:MAG TPA: DUF3616 domain-containing protein [Polyangiaceae bacterium]|nr:DUF3616 domain-containing protein [Polyangiaceae bacterium]
MPPCPAQLAVGLCCALSLLGCNEASGPRALESGTKPSDPPSTRAVSTRRPLVHFEGACDASGAVPLDERRFAVADDEDSVLRIYDAERGGPPLYTVDVSGGLDVAKKPEKAKKKAKRPPKRRKVAETDIEAATVIGQRAYWITSHARTKSGKRDPARFKFFATELPRRQGPQQPIGLPYTALVDDMLADPRLAALGLAKAAEHPPAAGGLNIEGMTATPEGKLLLGLRQPVHQGKAVVLTLDNPDGVLRGDHARFGPPTLLDLGGLGVRALSWWRGNYLVVAGARGADLGSRLYRWDGAARPAELPEVRFDDLNPEGFFTPEARDTILILSDDGTKPVGGEPCKELENPEHKRFRGLWLDLGRR